MFTCSGTSERRRNTSSRCSAVNRLGLRDDETGRRASSDTTNVELPDGTRRRRVRAQRPEVVRLQRCSSRLQSAHIVMGKTDPTAPASSAVDDGGADRRPRLTILRNLSVFRLRRPGKPRRVDLRQCAGAVRDVLKGEGEGFAIAQARLGPGRIHHCMRAIGMAERALELLCRRAVSRTVRCAARRPLHIQGLDRRGAHRDRMVRLLTLKAAYMMDTVGNKKAATGSPPSRSPPRNTALKIVDRAIPGVRRNGRHRRCAAGHLLRPARLRLADGPDGGTSEPSPGRSCGRMSRLRPRRLPGVSDDVCFGPLRQETQTGDRRKSRWGDAVSDNSGKLASIPELDLEPSGSGCTATESTFPIV